MSKFLFVVLLLFTFNTLFAENDILSVDYGPPPAADTWHKFTIPLTAETFGLESNVFLASMQNISMIRIRTEMHSGSDKCGIDSIAFGSAFLTTFDNGTENWSALGDGTMAWEQSEGVSGGYITIEDWTSGDWHWATAPTSWAGDLSANIGQNFTFYYKTNQPSYSAVIELHTGASMRIILSAEKQSLAAGESTVLNVSLSETPAEDVTINLSSSNSGLVSAPASVKILAGQNSASVTLQASQDIAEGDKIVVTASASGYETTRITITGNDEAPEIITLIVDDPPTNATLGLGENHWYQFQVSENGIHIIETHGGTDMKMILYENDEVSQITSDDDSGENNNAKISWDLDTGWYKVSISGYNSLTTGDYTIDVKTQATEELLPPGNLTAQVDEDDANDILLYWDVPTSGTPTNYNVYHSSSEMGTYTKLGSVTSIGARVTDNSDGTHWFYATAQYSGGESDPSNKAFATVGATSVEIPDILSVDYGPPPAANTWHKFTIPLTAETFGVENNVFLASMQNISMIRIRTEMHSGSDKCGIDSIAFGSAFLTTFDNGTENWSALGDGTMAWEQSEGVSGGYITIEDWTSGDWHWATAPTSWAGDLSANIGQNFTFYYKTNQPSYSAVIELHTGASMRIILSAEKQSLAAGESTVLNVSLSETPAEDVTINLSSSNSGLVSAPASVKILAGQNSASVTLQASQDIAEGDQVVITASASAYETTRITITGKVTTGIVSINDFEDIILYPNPSNGNFKIKFNNKSRNITNIKVFDLLGKIVHTSVHSSGNEIDVELRNCPDGIYSVKLTCGLKTYNRKIIIK